MNVFSEELIQQILDVWALDQDHPHRGRAKLPLPQYNYVKTIIEISFLASLKREEERPTNFGIVLSNQLNISNSQNSLTSPDSIIHFQEPKLFSVDTICKLATAFDPELSSLAVGPIETEKEDLYIWGVFTYQRLTHRFNELPVIIAGEVANRPDLFTVYVKQPGSLLIARSNSQIGRFVNGEFLPSTPTPTTSNSLGKYLIEQVKCHFLYEKYGNEYWLLYRDFIEVLLSTAPNRGHGSTIVVLPFETQELFDKYIEFKYRFKENIGLERLFERNLSTSSSEINTKAAINRLILEKLESIAQLAVVDGALILNNKLDVITYGATLNAPAWTGKVLIGPDGFGQGSEQSFEHKRLGTRHNSAIAFAGSCEQSIVFVISQDGPIRAFLQTQEDLFCWPDCSMSMFL